MGNIEGKLAPAVWQKAESQTNGNRVNAGKSKSNHRQRFWHRYGRGAWRGHLGLAAVDLCYEGHGETVMKQRLASGAITIGESTVHHV